MKTLLILRHAKSSWGDPTLVDHDRPLNKRGLRAAPCMGQLLVDQALVPDLIISSTAKRAHATARLVAERCDYLGEIRLEDGFYDDGPEAYLETLRRLDNGVERPLVVGHNPDLEILVRNLTGEEERMPTAALAQIALNIQNWRVLAPVRTYRLINLWLPRDLR